MTRAYSAKTPKRPSPLALPKPLRALGKAAACLAGIALVGGSSAASAQVVLSCPGTGSGGDRADLRGIVFTVDEDFDAIEARFTGNTDGSYTWQAELRRSPGFTGAADFTATATATLQAGASTPYPSVRFDFGEVVTVAQPEAFSLRFIEVAGPDLSYFETFGIGNEPCPDVMVTADNGSAQPISRGTDPAGFRVLRGHGTPRITAVRYSEDDFGSGGMLEMDVTGVEAGSILEVERNDDLEGAWTSLANPDAGELAMAPQLVENPTTVVAVHIEEDNRDDFFRVLCRPPTIDLQGQQLRISEPTPLDHLIAALNRSGDQQFSLRIPYGPDDVQDPFEPVLPQVPAGGYDFRNAADLSRLLELDGLELWESPPSKDDANLADNRYPPSEEGQSSVDKPIDLPGDDGEGQIDDGWPGDNITGDPPRGQVLDPGQFDMIYENPDLPGDNIGELQPPREVPDQRHVRVKFELARDGDAPPGNVLPAVIEGTEAYLVEESGGFLNAFPPVPTLADYVVAVSDAQGQILQITTHCDPLQVRVYNNDDDTASNRLFPNRGAHVLAESAMSSLHVTVPLGEGDPADDLPGLTVQFYCLTQPYPGRENILTPSAFVEAGNFFELKHSLSGEEIIPLLNQQNQKDIGVTAEAEITTLHRSGSNGSKWNIAIVAEGFDDSAADQDAFNDYAENVILDMFQTRDVHPEILNAINIFRINTFSEDSGVTQVDNSGNIIDGQNRATAFDVRFSGNWNRCWMENGPFTNLFLDLTVAELCPDCDQLIVVLNEPGFGGCARGNKFFVTRGAGWPTVAHEFGHTPGGLGDEYQCNQGATGCGCYPFVTSSPSAPNLADLNNVLSRSSLKWRRWVPSWRPLPTTSAQVADNSQDVGAFAGATIGSNQWWNCIYRPSWRGRMNNNNPEHNPRGYTVLRNKMRQYQEGDLRKCTQGDFDGDGLTDLVLLDGRQISLYLAEDRDVGPDDPLTGSPPRNVTGVLEPTWFNTDYIRDSAQRRSWQTRRNDQYYVGDFDGDGQDDIYIVNQDDWNQEYVCMLRSFGDHFEPVARYDNNLPGWQMRGGDEFRVADFDGDGDDDLLVYNGTNWSVPYFGMLRSNGSSLSMARRYDHYLPVWEMGDNEEFYVGDYNGDGREDIIAFDPRSWAQVHFRIYSSNGSSLSLQDRWYGTVDVPGPNWTMRRRDRVYPLDFNGDRVTDVAFFNGRDWGPVYLGLYSVEDGSLTGTRRYEHPYDGGPDTPLAGWEMETRDRHFVADVDGDNDDDLVVYNKDNWSTQYLGMLRSNGDDALSGSWQDDWIGNWNLGPDDQFKVADFRGNGSWDDLFVFNDAWFGLLRSYRNRYVLETIYRKWIHNHRFHEWGWW